MTMPFLSAQPNLIDVPHTVHLLRNPFLIFRLVLLALLGTLAFFTLVFASWNIDAASVAGISAPSTSIFIIFESCLFLVCIILAVAEFFRPIRQISTTIVECSWFGIMSVFQIAAAISSTVDGPATSCHLSPSSGLCASFSLLVPTTWLSSILTLAYFLTLLITAFSHKHLHRDIWRRTVYNVEWFGTIEEGQSNEKTVIDFLRGKRSSDFNNDPYRDFYEDIECTATRKKLYGSRDSIEESTPIRRGLDDPFPRTATNSNFSSPTPLKLSLDFPSFPGKSLGLGLSGSRYVEKFRESAVLSRPETPAQYTSHYHSPKSSFPSFIADHDKPIPLPRLSEWIKADAL